MNEDPDQTKTNSSPPRLAAPLTTSKFLHRPSRNSRMGFKRLARTAPTQIFLDASARRRTFLFLSCGRENDFIMKLRE